MRAFADLAAAVMEAGNGIAYEVGRRRYLETSGIPFFQQLELLFPGNSGNSMMADEFERRKLDGFFDEPYFDDVIGALTKLRERGIATAVSSNNFQHNVDEYVARNPAPLDHVLGFREGFAKGRDHFQYVMEAEGVSAAEIVFVGDSLKDGERALESGVAFVGRTGTFTRERFAKLFPGIAVVDRLTELERLVCPVNKSVSE
jgi:phosphoglycolate phosphatase-like HAD superfamily hydrolase